LIAALKIKFKQWLKSQQFDPEWLGVFVNPFFIARQGLRQHIEILAPALSGRVLDVGCGTKPYQHLFNADEYIGLDLDSPLSRDLDIADEYYDGNVFPFKDNEFDGLVCNQVLEHVFNPETFLNEISRVLKPGGKLLLTIPFVWDEHEQPFDYARYSTFGLKHLLEKQRFEVINQVKINPNIATIFQLLNAYFYKISLHWPRPLRLLFTISVMALTNTLGLLGKLVLPDNADLYLDQIVLAKNNE
jgi:SAM-dependent methyltransferase